MTAVIDYQAPIHPAPPRRSSTTEIIIFGLVMFAATIDLARKVSVVGISGNGGENLLAAGLVWAIWLTRPVLSHRVLRAVLPLILFNLDAAGSRFWSSTGIDGTQIQVIGLGFLGMMIVCARESAEDPTFAARLHKLILYASVFAVILSFHASATTGAEEEGIFISRRPFSLYAMPVVAVALAGWRSAATASSARNYLIWAVIVTFAVLCTQSRTALVACLLMFPLCIALRLDRKSFMFSFFLTIIVTGALAAAVFSYQPLYDRFFKYDAAIKVGGVAINASGRTKIWGYLWSQIGDNWIFGQGVATSVLCIRAVAPDVGQPHLDYLRFLFDQGLVGLGLWLLFMLTFFQRAIGDLRRSIQYRTIDYGTHMAAILAFVATLISMTTDNTYVYGFTMIPLGALMGASLGAGSRLFLPAPDAPAPDAGDWDGHP